MSDKTSLYRERMCIKIRSESSCSINGKVSSGWREVQGESNKNGHNNCSSWVIYQRQVCPLVLNNRDIIKDN